MRSGPDRLLALAGVAAGGTVVGHLLAYLLAFPATAERYAHLAETGHGSFPALARLSIVTGSLAVAVLAWRSLRAVRDLDLPRTVLLLGGLQLVGFAGLEIGERGFSVVAAASDPAVILGLAIQPVVAVAISFLLAGMVRAVRCITVGSSRSFPRVPRQPACTGRPIPSLPEALQVVVRRRGPPHLLQS